MREDYKLAVVLYQRLHELDDALDLGLSRESIGHHKG